MQNIPEVKLGLIAVSRDCFSIALSEARRAAIVKTCGGNIYECPVTVENEKDILAWARYNGLSFIQCACRVTERETQEEHTGKRKEIKQLIQQLKKTNPQIEENIFASLHRVWLDTFPGYLHDGEEHSFLERYKEND